VRLCFYGKPVLILWRTVELKRYKFYSIGFIGIALIISHIMCIHVTYAYSNMLCGIEHAGYSAPVNVAFILIIPYMAGAIIALVIALVFRKRAMKAAV